MLAESTDEGMEDQDWTESTSRSLRPPLPGPFIVDPCFYRCTVPLPQVFYSLLNSGQDETILNR